MIRSGNNLENLVLESFPVELSYVLLFPKGSQFMGLGKDYLTLLKLENKITSPLLVLFRGYSFDIHFKT
jgi:hypothetical protein